MTSTPIPNGQTRLIHRDINSEESDYVILCIQNIVCIVTWMMKVKRSVFMRMIWGIGASKL